MCAVVGGPLIDRTERGEHMREVRKVNAGGLISHLCVCARRWMPARDRVGAGFERDVGPFIRRFGLIGAAKPATRPPL
jgi:hypothetical protein